MADTVYNKVVVGNEVIINLDEDTFSTSDQLLKNITAHNNAGEIITGTLEPGGGEIEPSKSAQGTLSAQQILPSEGYDGIAEVYISPVSQTEETDTHGTALNIDDGATNVGDYTLDGSQFGNTDFIYVCAGNPTSIRDYAFHKASHLIDIRGLENLTTLGNSVFHSCTELTTISLPQVTTIGNYAFYGCTGLTSVDVSNATTIGGQAFFNCTGLTSVDVSNATSIGIQAFYLCTNLTNIQVKNGVTITPYSSKVKIATVNGHLYWQNGTSSNAIYRDSETTAIGTLTSSNLTFTDEYNVTFTRTSSSTNFTITWEE